MTARDGKGARTRETWGAVAILLVLYALSYLDRQVITLLVDPIRRALGASDFQMGLLQGLAFVAFYATCAIPIGWAVDRYPRRFIIFIGLLVWSLAASAGGLCRSFGQLLLARCGVGAGEAALAPAAYSILADLFPSDRLARAMALFSLGAIVGGGLSLAIGGSIVGLAHTSGAVDIPVFGALSGWRLAFLVTGAPGLALAFLVFFIREPERRSKPKPLRAGPPEAAVSAASGRFYVFHFSGFSLLGLVAAGYVSWAPTFLSRSYHWPAPKIGLVFGLISLIGGAAGLLGGGAAVDRMYRRGLRDAHLRYYAWMALVAGAGGVLATAGIGMGWALAGMSVVALTIPFIAIASAALQLVTAPERRGLMSALFLLVYNLVGFGLGPAIVAGLSDTLFHAQPNGIAHALSITFAIGAPVASLLLHLGRAPMRQALSSPSG